MTRKIRKSPENSGIVEVLKGKFSKGEAETLTLYFDDLNDLEKKTEKIRPSDDPEFQRRAEENQWKTRRDRGLPWKQDVFEFVQKTYGDLIDRFAREGRPLTQADIKAVDRPLWEKFQQESSKRGVPPELSLPPRHMVRLESVTDPEERAIREQMRALERQRSQLRRQLRNRHDS